LGHHRGSAPASIAAPRFCVAPGVRCLRYRLRGLAPRLTAARLIAHGDEQRGDVFAVLPGFGESRAGAMRLNPFRRQVDANGVGIGVGSFDSPLCARF
jgi:hypothetical protein